MAETTTANLGEISSSKRKRGDIIGMAIWIANGQRVQKASAYGTVYRL